MARLGFCGACPTETETSRPGAGFHRVFLAYKPIYMDCTLLYNGGRSTVWYAYAKEERAVILRDPLLFTLPRRGRRDWLRRGGCPPRRNVRTTRLPIGNQRHFFCTPAKLITYAPQNDRSENTTTRLFNFSAADSQFGEIAPF